MRAEYDLSTMKSRHNPYASKLKQSVRMRLSDDVIDYFKAMAEETIMQAIEFESQLEHGRITVPTAFHLAEGQVVRVLILLDERGAGEEAKRSKNKNILERTTGAWQGAPLVRESQGEYEQRLELE